MGVVLGGGVVREERNHPLTVSPPPPGCLYDGYHAVVPL